MSDPLDRLRGVDPNIEPPPADTFRARARKIQMKRRAAFASAGAATLVMIGVISFALFRPGTEPRRLATDAPSRGPSPPTQTEAATGGQPGSAVVSDQIPAVRSSEPAKSSEGDLASSGPAQSGASAGAPLRVELSLSSDTASMSQPVTMKLSVCNDSGRAVEQEFNTSQRYDFEVGDPRYGTVVWRWSGDKAFAQVIGKERYGPGCRVVGEETWSGVDQQGKPLPPGRYDAVGTLTSNPPRRTQPKTICATSCG